MIKALETFKASMAAKEEKIQNLQAEISKNHAEINGIEKDFRTYFPGLAADAAEDKAITRIKELNKANEELQSRLSMVSNDSMTVREAAESFLGEYQKEHTTLVENIEKLNEQKQAIQEAAEKAIAELDPQYWASVKELEQYLSDVERAYNALTPDKQLQYNGFRDGRHLSYPAIPKLR